VVLVQWRRLEIAKGMFSDHTLASDVGYCVLRCTANGTPTGRFLAFRGRVGKPEFEVLGGYDTADEAKAACDFHHAQRSQVA